MLVGWPAADDAAAAALVLPIKPIIVLPQGVASDDRSGQPTAGGSPSGRARRWRWPASAALSLAMGGALDLPLATVAASLCIASDAGRHGCCRQPARPHPGRITSEPCHVAAQRQRSHVRSDCRWRSHVGR